MDLCHLTISTLEMVIACYWGGIPRSKGLPTEIATSLEAQARPLQGYKVLIGTL